MHLKRVFPDSLTIEIDFDSALSERLWEMSRLCVRIWNLALEQRRLNASTFTSRESEIESVLDGHPEFQVLARSVVERVLWSLDEAFEQYHQTDADYKAHRRPDMITPPGPHSESDFFPLYFSSEYVKVNVDKHCLELNTGHGGEVIDLPLPKGDFSKADSALIMYQKDRGHFELEINPILADIHDK